MDTTSVFPKEHIRPRLAPISTHFRESLGAPDRRRRWRLLRTSRSLDRR